jgi:hypothetical protein
VLLGFCNAEKEESARRHAGQLQLVHLESAVVAGEGFSMTVAKQEQSPPRASRSTATPSRQ